MASKQHTRIKALLAPTQRTLYTEPITQARTDKKIKLHTNKNTFIFFILDTRPDLIFLDYKNKRTNINKLLKQYTQEEDTQQQFIKLLQQPTIIEDIATTLIIIEIIYICSCILNIDLTQFITYNSLDNLKRYYFILHRIHKNKT